MSLQDWWSRARAGWQPEPPSVRALRTAVLEPRLLLNGAPVDAPTVDGEAEQVALIDDPAAFVAEMSASQTKEPRRELILLDRRTPDADALLALLEETAFEREVLWIESDQDLSDVADAARAAAADGAFDAIHLLSHGDDLGFAIGSTRVDGGSIDSLASDLAGWRDLFTADGDFLIYGCSVAETSAGQELVARIAEATDADVAASDDLTGHAALAGDWVLELQVGSVETAALSAEAWGHVLTSTTVTFEQGVNGYNGIEDAYFDENKPDSDESAHHNIHAQTESGRDEHGFLKFADLFGSGANQIPTGATITNATLTLTVENDTNGTVSFHQLLSAVNDTDTWNSLVGGVQRDNTEAVSSALFTVDASTTGEKTISNAALVSLLQDWLDGTSANHGFAIFNDSDDQVHFETVEETPASVRPKLSVTYTTGPSVVVSNATDVVNGTTTSIAALIANDGGDGISLREALTASAATAGREWIGFNIGGGGAHTISLQSALPQLSDVVIDASTQPDYANFPLIMLDGASTTGNGLALDSNVTVRGLAIGNFTGNGIEITGTGNRVYGSWVGANLAGGNAGNAGYGILLNTANSADNRIGGLLADANAIINNSAGGVRVQAGTQNFVRVNAIHDNAGFGNVINGTALTSSDYEDGDSGPNGQLNQPEITQVVDDGTNYVVNVLVNTTASTTVTIDLYAAHEANVREAASLVSSVAVVSNGDGYANYEFTIAKAVMPGGTNAFSAQIETTEGTSGLALSVGIPSAGAGSTATSAIHETTTDNPDFRGERRTSTRAIAVANDGKHYVVWTEDDGGGSSIYGRLFAADGTALSGKTKINESNGDHHDASVSVDASGRFVVAWAESGDQHGHFRQLHADGSVNGGERTLWGAGAFGTTQFELEVESLPTGEFYIVYGQQSLLGRHLYYIGYNADGGQTTPFGYQLDAGASSPAREAVQALNKDGVMMVVWEEDDGLHLNYYDALSQTTLGTDTQFGAGDDVAITALPDGRFFLAITDSSGVNPEIHGQFVNSNGTLDGARFRIDEGAGGDGVTTPTVDANEYGQIAIGFERANGTEAYYKIIDSTGTTVIAQAQVPEDVTATQRAPGVAWAPGAETLWMAYQGRYQPISNQDGIYKRSIAVAAPSGPNQDPTANAGGPYAISRGSALNLDGSGSSDPDTDPLTYRWDLDNDGQYDDATGETPTVSWATLQGLGVDAPGAHTIGLEVDDGNGGTNTTTTTLTLTNNDPTANAGGPYTISRGSGLNLDGSGSSDANGDTLTYRWDVDNDGVYDDATGEMTTITWATLQGLGVDAAGAYTIGLEVDDGYGGLNTTTATLTLTNDNPVADAGGPYTINEGESVTLDASGSSDSNGDTLTYRWDLDNDGNFTEAGEPTGVGPTVNWSTLQSFGIDDDGAYTVGLQVDDGNGGVVTNSTTLTVNNVAPTLSVTGTGSATAGSNYTLNLSVTDAGDDTITGWRIDWGDGTIENVAGSPGNVTHTYAVPGLTHNVLVSATDEDGTYHTSDLLLTNRETNHVYRFAPISGSLQQQFGQTNLSTPERMLIGPDGLLYVAEYFQNSVQRFNPQTGAFVDEFVASDAGGLDLPAGMAFGRDGNLYIASQATDQILRFNGSTGAFIDVAYDGGSGSNTSGSQEVLFLDNGDALILRRGTDSVVRIDTSTGTVVGNFISSGAGGLNGARDMTFGNDGHLYITSYESDQVLRYNGSTGAFIDAFVTTGSGGLDKPVGLSFGPDGLLYVASELTDNILRYDGSTGAFVDVFASGNGLNNPRDIVFLPAHQVTVSGTPVGATSDSNGDANTVAEDATVGTTVGVTASATDPDGVDVVTYSLDDNAGGRFAINSTTGVVTVAGALDFESDAVHSITARATSSDGSSSTETINIAVTDVAPTISATGSGSVAAGSVYTLNLAANEPGGNSITSWRIDWGDGTVQTIAGNPGSANHTYANSGQTYNILVSATDAAGTWHQSDLYVGGRNTDQVHRYSAITGSQSLAIGVGTLDAPHSVTYGPDGLLYVSSNIEDAIHRFDPDTGAHLGVFVAAGSGGIDGPDDIAFGRDGNLYVADSKRDQILRFDGATGAFIDVFATIGSETTGGASSLLMLENGDWIVAHETANEIVRVDGSTGTVTGSFVTAGSNGLNRPRGMTFGGDGNLYVVSSGNHSVYRFNAETGAFVDVFVPNGSGGLGNPSDLTFGPDGNLYVSSQFSDQVLRYNGSDGTFIDEFANSGIDGPRDLVFKPAHQVTVNNTPVGPVSDANAAANSVAEDAAVNEAVGITATASDPDGTDTVTYSLDDSAGGRFAINSNTGVVTVAGALNHESNPSHDIVVRATSTDGSFTTDMFTVQVSDVDEAPNVTGPTSVNVPENSDGGTVIAGFTGSDPEAAGALTWSVVESVPFTMNGAGDLLVNGALDFETATAYAITVRARDVGGNTTDHAVTVNVTNVNEDPTITGPTNPAIFEDDTVGTVVGTYAATDPDAGSTITYSLVGSAPFAINSSTGVMTVNGPLDHETNPSYTFTVRASDGLGGTDDLAVTVDVGNRNEGPSVSGPTSVDVSDATVLGTTVATLTGTDPDAGDTLAWTILESVPFTMGGPNLIVNGPLDFATNPTYNLTVRVTDGGGLTADQAVTVNVTNGNVAPVLSGPSSLNVDENTSAGTSLGTYTATDANVGDTVSFSLVETVPFAINATTGELTVSGPLNFEATPSYTFTVRADDGQGGSDTQSLTVSINDVNEPPSIVGPTAASVAENVAIGTAVASYSANDPDADDMVSWSIVGSAPFAISPAGDLTVAGPLDRETTPSYTFTLRATDASAVTDDLTITVTVTDANEAPVAADDAITLAEDGTLTFNVLTNDVDPDGDTLSTVLLTGATNGTVTRNADNTFSYVPDANFHGADSFTYQATDGTFTSNATVAITVTAVNDAPTLADGAATVALNEADGTLIVDLAEADIDGDPLTYSIVSGNTGGAFAVGPGAEIRVADSNAIDPATATSWTLSVRASDGTAATTATVTISLGNSPPIAVDDLATVAEDGSVRVDVLRNDSDPDSNPMTTSLLSGPSHGAVTRHADGSFTYVPHANYHGADSFRYTVSDGVLTAQAEVRLNVTPVNDAPVFGGTRSFTTGFGERLVVNAADGLLRNAADVDGDTLTTVLLSGPADGTVTVNADGSFDYEPGNAPNVEFLVALTDGVTQTAPVRIGVSMLVAPAPSSGGSSSTSSASQSGSSTQSSLSSESTADSGSSASSATSSRDAGGESSGDSSSYRSEEAAETEQSAAETAAESTEEAAVEAATDEYVAAANELAEASDAAAEMAQPVNPQATSGESSSSNAKSPGNNDNGRAAAGIGPNNGSMIDSFGDRSAAQLDDGRSAQRAGGMTSFLTGWWTGSGDNDASLAETLEHEAWRDRVISNAGITESIEHVEDSVAQQRPLQSSVGQVVTFTGSAATVGYVVMALRSGALLTGLLAQMPAWRIIDPLIVLDSLNEGDGESLESMIEDHGQRSRDDGTDVGMT